jgi:hypothetical protein
MKPVLKSIASLYSLINMKQICLFVAIVMLTVHVAAQGTPANGTYDSIPTIHTFNQQLILLDKIRCATYLFVRDFRVTDSLGNIYVNLYFTNEFVELHARDILNKINYIHLVAYLFAFRDDLAFLDNAYKELVVNVWNDKEVVSIKAFPITSHSHDNKRSEIMDAVIHMLRIPTIYNVIKRTFITHFLCVDEIDQLQYHRPLIFILYQLQLLNKSWKRWKGIFTNCSNPQKDHISEIKLPR